jgi:hypothetical protein
MRTASVLVAAGLALAACHDSNATDAGPVTYNKASLTAAGSGSVTVPAAGAKPAMVCRIISATGSMLRDGDAGVANGDVMGDSWIELTPGAKIGIKNGTTTREMLIDGPGAVRACVSGEEDVWMASGTYTSVIGAGETPGSEVWVVTPHAVVRYGSGAHLTLVGGVPRLDTKLGGGDAWAYAVDGVLMHDAGAPHVVDGWTEIPVNANVSFSSHKSPSQVLTDCEQAAKAARDLGEQIMTRDASLAEAAPQHVIARRKAHAICAVAELVAARSLDPMERQRLLPRARAANAKWREL